jgi:hypothetical protein
MEVKQYVSIEIEKGGKVFTFNMPLGSTWGSAIDAAYEALDYVNKQAQEALLKAKPASTSAADSGVTEGE